MTAAPETVTLWRPVGPAELALIRGSGMRAFPPRLPERPIFYPVVTEDYAIRIARDWNVPVSGSGFVTRFAVRSDFLEGYRVEEAGDARIANIGFRRRILMPSMPRLSVRSRSPTNSAEAHTPSHSSPPGSASAE